MMVIIPHNIVAIASLMINLHRQQAVATEIDPQVQRTSSEITHCLSSNQPIQIKDPFNPELRHDTKKFIAVEWYQIADREEAGETQEKSLIEFLGNSTVVKSPRFSVFQFWGLQINEVEITDSATYKAILSHTSGRQEWSVRIVVAKPPVLYSEELFVSRTVNNVNKTAILSCGRLVNQGTPPVKINFQKKNGQDLPTFYRDGFWYLEVANIEDPSEFVCSIDMSSPAAKCIPEAEKSRFTRALTQTSQPDKASADMAAVIAGSVVAGVLAIVVIILVIIFIRRRNTNSEIYNAREQEEKRDREITEQNKSSLLTDKEDLQKRSQFPIYKGVTSPDSYLISKISDESNGLIFKKIKPAAPMKQDMASLNGKHVPPSTIEAFKQPNGTNGTLHIEEEELPQATPRSNFPSSSKKALDKPIFFKIGISSNEIVPPQTTMV